MVVRKTAKSIIQEALKMNLAWIFGMLVLTGVPAIVGGGLFWHLFEKWTPVIIWEVLLICLMSFIISKGAKAAPAAH
jgi:hypothetical protein